MAPHVDASEEHRLHGRTVLVGRFAGREVILAQSGVSMVNAAMTTQALLDRFAVARIVVSGVAGGLDPVNDVGRVLAPARWGSFLEVGMGRATPTGPVLPPLPGATDLPPFGMMIPRDVIVGRDDEAECERRWFVADPRLLDLARTLEHAHDLSVGGTGLSGTAFVDNAAYRDYLHATFDASVLDMETTAVAQVAFANRVPFIAFRSLSDLAGGEADANHLPDWLERACANVSTVTRAFIAALLE